MRGPIPYLGFAALLAALSVAPEAWAQMPPPATLPPVVVTATRTPRPSTEVASSVTVITAQEIANSGSHTLSQALEGVPGLEVVSNGTPGSVSSPSIRGSEAGQVLVLLDGVRLNSPQNGQFSLNDLPVDITDVERIEVLRGPASSLYGSNAFSGVIQIFTKRPEQEPLTRLTWGEGSHDTRAISGARSQQIGPFGYRISGAYDHSLGYRDNSDLNQTVLDGFFTYDLPADFQAELSLNYLGREEGVPGPTFAPSPEAEQKDDQFFSSLALKGSLGLAHLSTRGTYDRLNDRYADPLAYVPESSRHVNETFGNETQVDLTFGAQTFTVGGELYRDQLDSTDDGAVGESRWAGFAQDEARFGQWASLVLGVRYDSYSDFHDEWSPRATALVRATSSTQVRASVGKSFRAPTFNDRYWPDQGYVKGNPDLEPETAVEYELGVTQTLGNLGNLDVTGFVQDAKDLIDWQADENYVWSPVNVSKSRIAGVESQLALRPLHSLGLGANYTYLHPVDRDTGDFLPGKPRHQASAYAQFYLPADTQLRLDGRYARYYSDPTREQASYIVFDATLRHLFLIADALELQAALTVQNILDRDYDVNPGYPMPPREVQGTLTASF